MSVGQQGCMYGRCNICVASSDHVSPFFLNAKSTGAKNTIKGMSDVKKIKTKLVTIVTDNVRLVGIVGDKNLLARVSQEKER